MCLCSEDALTFREEMQRIRSRLTGRSGKTDNVITRIYSPNARGRRALVNNQPTWVPSSPVAHPENGARRSRMWLRGLQNGGGGDRAHARTYIHARRPIDITHWSVPFSFVSRGVPSRLKTSKPYLPLLYVLYGRKEIIHFLIFSFFLPFSGSYAFYPMVGLLLSEFP
ncbi:hypothetical protein PUN28_000755 [Cardiocondyla obscurior]|uniref:Uncharacterized protein n=1 Tax=Cardiocondyla obscurior TaxID=286306 RepID=A0AAW2H0U4_9HYME